jgi:pyruvate-formate lyase-activating enzyme
MVDVQGKRRLACRATLRYENDEIHRLITSVHLSRPENYPSIYRPGATIVAFTGGDVMCCPEFYGECARLIKANTDLWVLLETNQIYLMENVDPAAF